MNKVIGEDALRRALLAIPEDAGVGWLDSQLRESSAPLLDVPWILDIDTTIKPLYGKQERAVVSYNPKKPGRPSHSYPTDLMAGLRLVMGVEVKAGNEHSGSHTLPGLLRLLDELPAHHKPKMVRGDCGFGSEGIMRALEARAQPYLFKLRLSKNVKRHIERLFRVSDWTEAGQGWEGIGSTLALTGWEDKRRVLVLRRPLQGEMLRAQLSRRGHFSRGVDARLQIAAGRSMQFTQPPALSTASVANPVDNDPRTGKPEEIGEHAWKMSIHAIREPSRENFKAYEAARNREVVQPGRMFAHETGQLTLPRFIDNFPAKHHRRGKSHIKDSESGLAGLITR
jgi:hypothetical protein